MDEQKKKSFFNNFSPKGAFFSGAFTGIAVIAIVGVIILLTQMYGGGLNLPKKNTGTNTNSPTVAAPTGGGAAPVVELTVSPDDHIRGNPDAKITLIEFSDFECPFCSRFHPTMQQLLSEYGDDVRWVYKHFPLNSIHPQAQKAAEASECAWDQGGNDAFWAYGDGLFENQSRLGSAFFSELAGNLGLNVSQFDQCLSSGQFADKVAADYQAGLANGVNGTPGTFVNGQLVPGAVPYEQLQSFVEAQL
jgi:protein-disulfide isomerase